MERLSYFQQHCWCRATLLQSGNFWEAINRSASAKWAYKSPRNRFQHRQHLMNIWIQPRATNFFRNITQIHSPHIEHARTHARTRVHCSSRIRQYRTKSDRIWSRLFANLIGLSIDLAWVVNWYGNQVRSGQVKCVRWTSIFNVASTVWLTIIASDWLHRLFTQCYHTLKSSVTTVVPCQRPAPCNDCWISASILFMNSSGVQVTWVWQPVTARVALKKAIIMFCSCIPMWRERFLDFKLHCSCAITSFCGYFCTRIIVSS